MASAEAVSPRAAPCAVCRNLDIRCPLPVIGNKWSTRINPVWQYEIRWWDLTKSAEQGCSVCSIMVEYSRSAKFVDTCRLGVQLDTRRGPLITYTDIDGTWVEYSVVCLPEQTITNRARFRDSLLNGIPIVPDISEGAWSGAARRFAQYCIRQCTEEHEACPMADTVLPTRVIDLGPLGDNDLQNIRIFENQDSMVGRYTALSYCWGTGATVKTTSGNLAHHTSSGIKLSSLPQTLRDAVQVTRYLGIRYIWIDALCIVQDSPQDWEEESLQMATIYKRAYLVIMASSSSSADQGFLHHRRTLKPKPFKMTSEHGTEVDVVMREAPQSGLHGIFDEDKRRDPDPLGERAWAFQEQQMATRCLIFSPNELQWRCRALMNCECGRLATEILGDYGHTQITNEKVDPRARWRNAIEQYSGRQLTDPDDKLPALSGLAKYIAAKLGSRYIAGLWEDSIIEGLAWHRLYDYPVSTYVPPSEYRAPSFSWASINGSVAYDTVPYKQKLFTTCRLIEANSIVPGRNPFGRVEDGWLILEGPLIEGKIIGVKNDMEAIFRWNSGSDEVRVVLDSDIQDFIYATDQDGSHKTSMRRRTFEECNQAMQPDRPEVQGIPSQPGETKRAEESMQVTGRQSKREYDVDAWLLCLGRKYDLLGHQFFMLLGRSPRDPDKFERLGIHTHFYSDRIPLSLEGSRVQTITII